MRYSACDLHSDPQCVTLAVCKGEPIKGSCSCPALLSIRCWDDPWAFQCHAGKHRDAIVGSDACYNAMLEHTDMILIVQMRRHAENIEICPDACHNASHQQTQDSVLLIPSSQERHPPQLGAVRPISHKTRIGGASRGPTASYKKP